ncbi:MAG: tetratricopeptide repeat protein, partial [Chloroflexi bacterium]|nr:tetratricopeptide repeat protein [Chloroflexota bacterium]
FVLAGPAVDEAAAAERQAEASQVMASRAILAAAGLEAKNDFNLVADSPPGPERRPRPAWHEADEAALAPLVEAAAVFVHPALAERLQTAGVQFIAEHRPVTSVFVQFEGIDFDDDNAGHLLQLYHQWASQVVARYGGANSRLNRVLTGDKGNQLHIIFGAPVAPDAPEQALRCALALQREKPAFITNQRIGLAAGKVFACPVGSEERREYTVVGDVVNLSARLTQVCPDHGVLADEAAANRGRTWIEFERLPAVHLKGKQELVSLHRAIGERITANRVQAYFGRWQRPIIGRSKELDLLLSGLDPALDGTGGVAALSGSLGVGKSRLLAEGGRYWLQAGGQVLMGECQPHTTDTPFGPWLSVWRDFFGLQADMTDEEWAARLVVQTEALYPAAGGDVGLWGEVMGLAFPQAEELAQLPAEVRQARFFNLVRHCFQVAAHSRPLFIILEDVHWADQSSLALVDTLSEFVRELPIFIALTYRPEVEFSLETLSRPICLPIVLADLPPQEARELVTSLLGVSELPPAVERHLGLLDREGLSSPVNPLFLEEALRVMLETGILQVNGRLQVDEARLARMPVPDTIHGLLLARLDGLPAASRDILQVASVIGRQFALDMLRTLKPATPQDELVDLLGGLSLAELIQLLHSDPELTYLFHHAMTQEVAYESLPYARRQALHAAIADWLVERYADNLKPYYPILAYHYSRTDIHDKGLQYALAAADEARDIFANKEAVELYNLAESHLKVLGVEENWETAVELYLSRGAVLRLLGDFATALIDSEQALKLSSAYRVPAFIARSYNLLADIKYRQAKYDEVMTLAGVLINDLSDQVPQDELARAFVWSGMAASKRADYKTALTNLQKAEAICLQTGNKQQLARVLESIAFIHYSQQKLELALGNMERSVVLFRNFSTPGHLGFALNNIAQIQFSLGQPGKALATLNEAYELTHNTSRNALAVVASNRAEILSYLGRYPEALADFKEAVSLFALMNDEYSQANSYLLWGYEYCCALEEWADAKDHFAKVQELISLDSQNYPEEMIRLLIGQGQVELKSGSIEKAESLLEEATRLIEENNLSWWRPVALYFHGLTKLTQGESELAYRDFRKALDAFDQGGCPDYLPLILLELGMLTFGEEKRSYFEKCVKSALKRCRYKDRIWCFSTVGSVLQGCEEPGLQALRQYCLQQLQVWSQR